MNKKFTFDKEKHVYELDGKPMMGVTTVLGIIAKPALIPWAVKMATEYIKAKSSSTKGEDEITYHVTESILKASKSAHRKKKEAAGDIGSDVHEAIEEWIKNKTIPTFTDKRLGMFNKFVEWADENVGEFIESEKRLYSEKHWYAGTVDMIFKDKEGKLWIGDVKTSKAVYAEHFAQMGGYHIAYDEMGNEENVVGYQVIRIGKDETFEVVGFDDTKMSKEFFLNALGLYKIKKNLII